MGYFEQFSVRRSRVIAVWVVVILMLGTTSGYAAHGTSLPGSFLYPFKQAWEKGGELLAFSPTSKAKADINIAKNRIDSVKQHRLSPAVVPALQTTKQQLSEAQDQAKKIKDSSARQEVEKEISDTAGEAENEVEHETESANTQDKQNLQQTHDQLQQVQNQSNSDD